MVFAHDTEVALQAAAALVNTATTDPDSLADVAQLTAFVQEWRWTGAHRRTAEELAQVQVLRPRLRRLWGLSAPDLVEGVNALLRDARAMPQLVRHDEWDWHLHATRPDQPLAERMAVEAAMALVDLIRAGEFERLQECAAQDCENVLVDLSRNRSRRYCEQGCGNRLAARAYRTRRATGSD